MILNKEKIELIKASKTKSIKGKKEKDKNKKENIYFQNIIKNNSIKYEENISNINPQMKNINDNIKSIFSSDESKKKALKFIFRNHQLENKDNNLNELSKYKTIDNNQIHVSCTEPENNIIQYKGSINQRKDINNKRFLRNGLIKNESEKIMIRSENKNDIKNGIKYNKIEYNNKGYKTPYNNYRNNSNNNYNSITYEKENYNLNINENNNNEYILDNKLYKVTKKLKIPKPSNTRRKSSNILESNKVKNKTLNSFYINKKPSTYSVNENRNNFNKENLTNDLSDFNEAHTMIFKENIDYLNQYSNKTIDDKRNIIRNKYNKRKNNKIRIIDSAKAIKEFNISFPEDDISDNFLIHNKNKYNYRTINNEQINVNKNKLYENYNKYYYMRNLSNIPSININQFNINANNNNSAQNYKYYDDYLSERNYRNHSKNENNYSNDIYNKNFDININNNILINDNNLNLNEGKNNIKSYESNDKNNKFKVLVKKRPLNEMKIKNISYKKFQNLKYIQENDKEDKNNNHNEEKFHFNNNTKTFITEKMSFSINPNINHSSNDDTIENKNENMIIIIKKKNKELLNKICIEEENIEKINEKLLNEKFAINNIPVKFISLINKDEDKDKSLKGELERMRNENDILNKKDKLKSELINKLDKEKQNLIEEINRLNKEINLEKMKNEKIIKEKEKIKEENIKVNNILNDIMKEENKEKEEIFDLGNIGGINFNIDIESINDGQEKNEELINKEEIK